jgi:ribosomal protein S12 methylthiotransferase
MGVFTYSDVDTAASHALGRKVAESAKIARRDRLMAIQRKISARKLAMRVGHSEIALLEGPSAETELLWEARLEGMAPEIDGKLYINDIVEADGAAAQPGDMVRVEITEAHDYDLIGRVTQIVRRANLPVLRNAALNPRAAAMPVAPLGAAQRISTGAPLRIIQ